MPEFSKFHIKGDCNVFHIPCKHSDLVGLYRVSIFCLDTNEWLFESISSPLFIQPEIFKPYVNSNMDVVINLSLGYMAKFRSLEQNEKSLKDKILGFIGFHTYTIEHTPLKPTGEGCILILERR